MSIGFLNFSPMTLALEAGQGLFIREGCLVELDLIGNSVGNYIGSFCKVWIVFVPFLTELFSDELFKEVAPIVLRGCKERFEIFNRAEGLGVRQKVLTLTHIGLKSKAVALIFA